MVVALILLFIFATPREWFRDQPKASSIILMSSLHGSNRVFIATELLEDVPDYQRPIARRAFNPPADRQDLARGARGTYTG